MNRSAVLATTVVLALGGLSACGGGDDEPVPGPPVPTLSATIPPTPTSPAPTTRAPAPAGGLSKAEFLTRGNAICAAANAQIERAVMSVAPDSPSDIAFVTKSVIAPSVTAQVAALRALGIPSADRATVEATLVQAEAVVTRIRTTDAPDLDPDTLFDGVNAKLVAYGLTTCGAS